MLINGPPTNPIEAEKGNAPPLPALARCPTNPYVRDTRKRKKIGIPTRSFENWVTLQQRNSELKNNPKKGLRSADDRKTKPQKEIAIKPLNSVEPSPKTSSNAATKDDLIAELKSASKKNLQKRNKSKPKAIEEDPLSFWSDIPEKIRKRAQEFAQEESDGHDDDNNSPCSWSTVSLSIRPAPVHVPVRRDSSLETASPGVTVKKETASPGGSRQLTSSRKVEAASPGGTEAEKELKKLTNKEKDILEQQALQEALICDAECQERIKNRMKYLRILRCETGVSETVTTDSDSSS